jgi:AraC-like DNA-binding protein
MAGQLTRQLALRPTGRMAVVGVRFHPDGASAVVDVPQHGLAGLTLGLELLSAALCRALNEVRDSTDSPARAVPDVLRGLAAHVDPTRTDPRVRQAVEIIRRRRCRVSIDRLAAHLGLTRRHLERRFKMLVGLSPKRLARIARFQDALRVLSALEQPHRSTQTAMTCGYADQAHFVREFRELAGCPPGAHLLRDAQLAGFFAGH